MYGSVRPGLREQIGRIRFFDIQLNSSESNGHLPYEIIRVGYRNWDACDGTGCKFGVMLVFDKHHIIDLQLLGSRRSSLGTL